jgi:hypothetical protein
MSSTPADQPPTDVERSAPEAQQTGAGDGIRFAAVGLDHSHIFGQISGLLGQGCQLVGIGSDDREGSVAMEVRNRWPDAPWFDYPEVLLEREIAADHPGLAAPARVIAMRAQGEAEIAIEQGETRFEGVRWVTPHQIAANQVIPLPEPARCGLVNAATDVAEATNQAVAAAAHLRPTVDAPRAGGDGARRVGRAAPEREIPVHHPNRGGRSR